MKVAKIKNNNNIKCDDDAEQLHLPYVDGDSAEWLSHFEK